MIGLVIPITVTSKKSLPLVEAMTNARQIGLALDAFEQDFGKTPDWNTIAVVKKETRSTLPLGTKTSNDYFRQLVAAGLYDGEKLFFANIKGVRKTDYRAGDTHLLEKGECGFTYILGGSFKNVPPRPLLVTPMIPGTDRFDPKPFKGKAVILWTDFRAERIPIDEHGHVTDSAGRNLFDPANPVWGGASPMIAWPDL
ncbi:MAG: hypothetical protein H8M99_04345 [Gloeobacteraceae cyanobacterium ES-bin-144]|nr:hypothetical protein [Verrucomicrobiales bacterium]